MVPTLLVILLVCLPLLAQAESLFGRVTAVTDGDTISVLVENRPIKVRLAEIDTPERNQPWGSRAKKALSRKVFGQNVKLVVFDRDRYGRLVAHVYREERPINREMVAEGHAWAYRKYLRDKSLLELEQTARSQRRGLWTLAESERVPPWQWRKGGARKPRVEPARGATFSGRCEKKRYCREMASCAEARFYLSQCGLSRLDGDKDGIPCEALCRP